jgi:dynactin complex subunit
VLVSGRLPGWLRYVGHVGGKTGVFYGVELDAPIGKNDGTHNGQ